MIEKLKPCPFRGGNAELESSYADYVGSGLVNVDFTTGKLNGHMVWGIVTYNRKLSQQEIEAYELTEVSE